MKNSSCPAKGNIVWSSVFAICFYQLLPNHVRMLDFPYFYVIYLFLRKYEIKWFYFFIIYFSFHNSVAP